MTGWINKCMGGLMNGYVGQMDKLIKMIFIQIYGQYVLYRWTNGWLKNIDRYKILY